MQAAQALLRAALVEREVLDVATALLGDRFGYGSRGILIYDPARGDLGLASVAGRLARDPQAWTTRLRLGQGIVGTAALEQRTLNVPDARSDPRAARDVPESIALLAAPMVSAEGDLLGVVAVDSPDASAFDQRDEVLLSSFARLVALALMHARSHEARRTDLATIRRQLEVLEAIHEVTQRATELDLGQTLQVVVEAFRRVTTADSVAVYQWSPADERLVLAALSFDARLYPADHAQRTRSDRLRLGEGLVGWVAERGEPVHVGDVAGDPRVQAIPGVDLGDKSGIVVPITSEGRLLGVIRAAKMGRDSFSEEHFRLARTLASESALALSAASARLAETDRAAELAVLHDTSVSLSRTADSDDALGVVLRGAVRIAGADAGLIVEVAGAEMVARASTPNVDLADYKRRRSRQSTTGELVATGRPVIVDDVVTSQRVRWALNIGMGSALGVPLRRGEQVIGALYVAHRSAGYFGAEHVRQVETLASQAAAALERARAHEEARRLAITDDLTGLHNSRHFRERLAGETERAARYLRALALIMVDSDSLKIVNDRFGHDEGNRHLIALARTIEKQVRSSDIVARFGGDEFLVLQPETAAAPALLTAGRICADLRREVFTTSRGEAVRVSVSAGVAAFPESASDADDLFRQADLALYEAKQQGKDRACAAPPRKLAVSG